MLISVWITEKLFTLLLFVGLCLLGGCGEFSGYECFFSTFSTLFKRKCYKLCIFAVGKLMLWISVVCD